MSGGVQLPCSRAPGIGGARGPVRGPDLLRIERFGAMYYRRADAAFYALEPEEADLMVAAEGRSVLEVYRAAPASWTLSELEVIAWQARAQARGWLDAQGRRHAQLVTGDRSHGALIGPLVTHLQLTRSCNLRCTHCYVDVMAKRHPEELSVEELDALFGELEGLGAPVLVLAGGEPMVRRDFFDVLAALDRHHMDAWLCTNGTMIGAEEAARLAQSSLRGLSVSLDGPDAETHAILRGPGRFERTVSGLRHLVEAGAQDVQIRVTVTPHNADGLAGFAALARDIGVHKVVLKPFRMSGEAERSQGLYLSMAEYQAAVRRAQAAWPEDAPELEIGDGMPSRPPRWTRIIPTFGCVGGTTSATITYRGRVVGCGSVLTDEDASVREAGFGAAWRHAPSVDKWRRFEGNSDCASCTNLQTCGGGCRARAVGLGADVNAPDPWSHCGKDDALPAARARLRVLA